MHSYPHTFLFLIIFVSLNSSKVILKTLFVPNELSYHFYSHKSVNSYCYCYSFHSILFSNKNKKKLSLFLISQLIQHAMTVKIDGKAIPQLSVVLSHPIDYLFSFFSLHLPFQKSYCRNSWTRHSSSPISRVAWWVAFSVVQSAKQSCHETYLSFEFHSMARYPSKLQTYSNQDSIHPIVLVAFLVHFLERDSHLNRSTDHH